MKKTLAIVFLFLIVQASIANNKQGWTAYDPESIPLEIRKSYLQKGNLVLNASFEEGEVLKKDTLIKEFKLKNWEKVGNNVEWVDANLAKYDKKQVNEGNHAIKIHRKSANETDVMGEGVMSDFIEVIPGNYTFYYNVRLEKVYSAKGRMGTKLYDAIDVRVLFFDENKQPIDGKTYYPYFKSYLDNSFKGYTFSNFFAIPEFPWGKVLARTYNYPFSEGDTPDNVKYVKLFLGLKGKGTMWIDDVDFRFSRWNFTAKEKLADFIDKTYKPSELLVPQPKQLKYKNTIKLNKAPIILIPQQADNATKFGAELLQKELSKLFADQVKILTEASKIYKDQIIFSIGKTALFNKNKSKLTLYALQQHQQGYIIQSLNNNVIYGVGKAAEGDYYAAATLAQLIDYNNATFDNVDVKDEPDFVGRGLRFIMSPNSKEPQKQLDYIKDYLQDMMTYKTNKMYNDYSQGFVEDRWKETLKNQVFKDFYKELGEFLRKTGVGYLAFVIHPYLHFSYEMHVKDMDKEQQYYFLHSREEDNQTLIDIIKIAMDAGARTVMLMSDDFVPHEGDYQKIYSLWTPEDKKKFISLQYAQAYTINKVYDFLAQNYPNSRLEFCPPYYLNEFVDKTRGYAEAYFRDLIALIPQDVAIVWTGNTVRSLSFDMADIKRFKDLIGRYPMLWDNTLYARSAPGIYGGYPAYYPGKSKMCNIFEPFDVDLPKDFYKYNDGYEIYMNNLFNEVYRFKNATTADYHWNNNAYNPDFSLWKVMLRRVGKEKAIKLIDFNDAFYHSMQAVVQIEYTGDTQKWQKIAEKYLTNLNTLTNDLAVMFSSSPKLVEELKEHNNYLTNRYAESLKGTNIKKEGLEQIR